ncbi:hypothetical protein EI427_24840 [Flammeovirga pectinis]|uniref:Uncharacterized protein n=1 Tax=Flammeovirga pectinis TaxID=2494373 RepID=A0A3S9PB28_9BACT|nr:hypothetical protein [Flammeovirga pectinis]AZQ65441.1 hypothetical protein EI427_24840 [Flammeovirga pectinis]
MTKLIFNFNLLSLLLLLVSTDTLKKDRCAPLTILKEDLNSYVPEIIDSDKLIVSTIQNTKNIVDGSTHLDD